MSINELSPDEHAQIKATNPPKKFEHEKVSIKRGAAMREYERIKEKDDLDRLIYDHWELC